MYSLYRKIYQAKEKAIETNLKLAAEGKESSVFDDTKEQNGCCRVGQTKIFGKTYPTFSKQASKIRHEWLLSAKESNEKTPDLDFHLHMISTIPGADELYEGKSEHFSHQDEMWIWIPDAEIAVEHLKSFLSNFRSCPAVLNHPMEVEFLGENAKELKQIFEESFKPIPARAIKEKLPIAVLKFKAGSINSRKALITPYLPQLA